MYFAQKGAQKLSRRFAPEIMLILQGISFVIGPKRGSFPFVSVPIPMSLFGANYMINCPSAPISSSRKINYLFKLIIVVIGLSKENIGNIYFIIFILSNYCTSQNLRKKILWYIILSENYFIEILGRSQKKIKILF